MNKKTSGVVKPRVREKFDAAVLRLNSLIALIATKASVKTRAHYRKVFKDSKKLHHSMEKARQEGIKRTFYVYRAAWLYGCKEIAEKILESISERYANPHKIPDLNDSKNVRRIQV